jgi:hypothetical protein
VTQGVGPEFKAQSAKNKNKQTNKAHDKPIVQKYVK